VCVHGLVSVAFFDAFFTMLFFGALFFVVFRSGEVYAKALKRYADLERAVLLVGAYNAL
jgi:hypothetical protein